ncbi:hypothetical protein ATANTOWER_013111 [Ataeniobius toweri]|uniref:Immunoglobulin domain-containing protein n=1 Tax=Ataeniobius toweri TaxID=208326 RepID=A0ABU7A6Q7_9TELE|nr:hypothetical protein [Ataeniobius toweri]
MHLLMSSLILLMPASFQVRNSSSVDEMNHFHRVAGEDLSITCYGLSSGTRRIFCRENCEGENVLVNTTSKKAINGRSSVEYFERAHEKSFNLSVAVSNLTQSDSGLYRCGLVDNTATYAKFKVVVAEAQLDGNSDHHFYKEPGSWLTVACSFSFSGTKKYFCRGDCGEDVLLYTDGVRAQSGRYSIGHGESAKSNIFYVTIKNLTRFDSGQYRCLSYLNSGTISHVDFHINVSDDTSGTTDQSRLYQNNGATSGGTSVKTSPPWDLPLIVIVVALAVTVILLSAALLVSCRRRSLQGEKTTNTLTLFSLY